MYRVTINCKFKQIVKIRGNRDTINSLILKAKKEEEIYYYTIKDIQTGRLYTSCYRYITESAQWMKPMEHTCKDCKEKNQCTLRYVTFDKNNTYCLDFFSTWIVR